MGSAAQSVQSSPPISTARGRVTSREVSVGRHLHFDVASREMRAAEPSAAMTRVRRLHEVQMEIAESVESTKRFEQQYLHMGLQLIEDVEDCFK